MKIISHSNIIGCLYCRRLIDKRGWESHLHFKHAGLICHIFSLNPTVQYFVYGRIVGFDQLQLPAETSSGD